MNKYVLIIALCLTLGLAPFVPEPHIIGKFRWILGGAEGMRLIDWWDTLIHGAPWLLFVFFIAQDIFKKIRQT